jgi:hypothetical protein
MAKDPANGDHLSTVEKCGQVTVNRLVKAMPNDERAAAKAV